MSSRFCHVTGRFLAPTGVGDEPLAGVVTFRARAASVVTAHATYLPAPVMVELDENGYLVADLLAPTEETQPVSWTWQVSTSFRYKGVPVPWKCFDFAPVAGQSLDLGQVAPVPDPVTGQYVTRGETGPAPELSIGEVTTVPAGQETVTITGPADAPVLDFALPAGRLGWTGDRGPRGLPGKPGPAGPAGISVQGIQAVGQDLVFIMSDGTEHRVPLPTGLRFPASAGALSVPGDGTGRASGSLLWEDNGDGTGWVSTG